MQPNSANEEGNKIQKKKIKTNVNKIDIKTLFLTLIFPHIRQAI